MIFFLYGRDTFRSHEKLKNIRGKYFEKIDPGMMNASYLDGESLTLNAFREKVSTRSFFAAKRMAIIKNFLLKSSDEETAKYIGKYIKSQDSPESAVLIFLEEGGLEEIKKNKATFGLFKALQKIKYAQEFKPLNQAELTGWIEEKFSERSRSITGEAVGLLISQVGNDLWQMNNEIIKLSSYSKEGRISIYDIHELVKGRIDDNIFNLVDAISLKNKKMVLSLISDQLNSGATPPYLHAMITRQFRIMIKVKSLLEENKTVRQISKALPLHPYVISKTINQLKYYSMQDLKKIYDKLFHLDIDLKSTSKKPQVLFALFISSVAS